jgi:spore coat polysaccharide biosynthesis protein SpsF
LLDPDVSSMIVARFLEAGDVDYCSNKIPQSFPRGLDTEVFRFSALERARHQATESYERVHATPYLYRHPKLFRLLSIRDDIDRADWRWTVDTQEDLDFVRTIYRRLGPEPFTWIDVIRLMEAEPHLRAANAHVRQKGIEEC